MSKTLQQELSEFQSTLDLVRKQYAEDGTIAADAQSHLDVLEGKIKRLLSTAGSSNSGNGNGQPLTAPRLLLDADSRVLMSAPGGAGAPPPPSPPPPPPIPADSIADLERTRAALRGIRERAAELLWGAGSGAAGRNPAEIRRGLEDLARRGNRDPRSAAARALLDELDTVEEAERRHIRRRDGAGRPGNADMKDPSSKDPRTNQQGGNPSKKTAPTISKTTSPPTNVQPTSSKTPTTTVGPDDAKSPLGELERKARKAARLPEIEKEIENTQRHIEQVRRRVSDALRTDPRRREVIEDALEPAEKKLTHPGQNPKVHERKGKVPHPSLTTDEGLAERVIKERNHPEVRKAIKNYPDLNDSVDDVANSQDRLKTLQQERQSAKSAAKLVEREKRIAVDRARREQWKKQQPQSGGSGGSGSVSKPSGGATGSKTTSAVNRFAKVNGKVAQLQKLGGIFATSYKGYFSRGFQGMLSLGGTILEGFQTLSDAYTVLAGGAYIFTQQVAQANDLGAHTMALVNGYRDAGYHKSLDDMFKLAREIDQEVPDGLYGADALSTFSAGIEIDVIKHRDQCQDLLTVMQEVYRRAFTGEQLSKKLLSDHTFLVAASYVNAEQDLWKAYQDFGKIMGALNVEYLEGHLKIVNEDLKRIQDSIINDLTFGYLDEG
jgi:hypothetical protein